MNAYRKWRNKKTFNCLLNDLNFLPHISRCYYVATLPCQLVVFFFFYLNISHFLTVSGQCTSNSHFAYNINFSLAITFLCFFFFFFNKSESRRVSMSMANLGIMVWIPFMRQILSVFFHKQIWPSRTSLHHNWAKIKYEISLRLLLLQCS